MIRAVLASCLFLAAAAGCRRAPPAPPTPPPPTVTVVRPVLFPVQSYHEYNGYLESVETVQIRARVKGILKEVLFNENEGGDIEAGTDLYTIDPREYDSAVKRAEADITRAEADIEKSVADAASADAQAKSAAATSARLRRAGTSASGDELDKAIAAATTAEANKKVADAQKKVAEANKKSGIAARETALLNVEYTHIKAPITGRISRTLVTKGNLVGQTDATLLTTIVRLDKLYVYFDAPERDLVERTRVARSGSGPTTSAVELGVVTEEGFPHAGTIDFLENRVEPGTGTVRIRGRIDNKLIPDRTHPKFWQTFPGLYAAAGSSLLAVPARPVEWELYPGLFARVRLPAGPRRDLLCIPEEALMTGQEGSYVYVVGDGNLVQKRSVTVASGPPIWRTSANGTTGPVWSLVNPKQPAGTPPPPLRSVVAIEKGLTDKDVVIVNGLQKARPAAPVTPDEWAFRAPAAK